MGNGLEFEEWDVEGEEWFTGGVEMIRVILLVFAFVLFLCAAFNVSFPKVQFGWLGLAFLTAAEWLPLK